MRQFLLLPLLLIGISINVYSQSVMHYWNFNNFATVSDLLAPSRSIISGAEITYTLGNSSVSAIESGSAQGFDLENLNSVDSDPAGTHLRFNEPIGGELVFSIPTTGYKDVVVKFATRRSGSGAGTQKVAYSVDGSNFTHLTDILPANGDPTLQTLDFSSITEVNNNPDFKLKITFEQGSGGLVGNNRFDNLTVEGNTDGEDLLAPVVAFNPTNGADNILENVNPTLTFNEDIRMIDDSPLDNNNVDDLVELRLDNESGPAVTFDASVSGRVITITPSASLTNDQNYYIALKPNTIEDMVGNAITQTISSGFTITPLQTEFQPGDLVIVAYRMNATSTEDEIAFLTLVDILPGTMIRFADAKYTTNAQAQCTGGLVWTAPEEGVAGGTVISINNDLPTTSHGTISGSKFGLSSDGDQIMVYTGTAEAANHITALSSNEWITSNTSCSGSLSILPATLEDGISSINLSGTPGNVEGNSVNAYYNGQQTGTDAELRTAILNPANWIAVDRGTPAQVWPAWAFPGPPSVVNVTVINQNTIRVIFNQDLDNVSATNTANFTGISDLTSVVRTDNGAFADTLLLQYGTPFSGSASYQLTVNGVENADNVSMYTAYNYSFTYDTKVFLSQNLFSVTEGATVTIQAIIHLENPSESSVDVVLKPSAFNTAGSGDFNFTTQTLNFTGDSEMQQIVSITVLDDIFTEQDEYFVVSLENCIGCTINGNPDMTIYIKDNDREAPTPTKEIELNFVNSFKPANLEGSTAEIVMHDPLSQKLFIVSSIEKRLDIADFTDPANIVLLESLDMTSYGGITSVAVKNGIVAVASPNADEQQNGSVIFFNTDGDFISQVTVGALPDMITFTPDGLKVLTANEGQPNESYTVDPKGSVSVIDISLGTINLDQTKVTTIYFDAFEAQENILIQSGVRKLKATSTFSQDFEPEYITVSSDSKKAWITLQENNAIAELDLQTNEYTSVWPLGTKDFNTYGNGFDASDNSGIINISNWPVKGFFIPDAVANYNVGGINYLVTANEGDEKEYAGLNERTTVGNDGYVLDPSAFPNASVLKQNHNLGRLRVSNLHGDTDQDGDIDEIFMVGCRSFTIWNADTKERVYDSGDDFEMITSTDPSVAPLFNADNEDNDLKSRSRAKGPEPEGVALATIGSETYAFIALERVGGIMVYNITDPTNVEFVDYKNSRSLTAFEGDHGPEGIIYISSEDSPDGIPYILVANEISGTVSVFELQNVISAVSTIEAEKSFTVYPNPVSGTTVKLSESADMELMNSTGSLVMKMNDIRELDVSSLNKGIYLLKTGDGKVVKLIVQ